MNDSLLYKFICNETSEEETEVVLDWLDADPANQHYFDRLDRLLNIVRLNDPTGGCSTRKPVFLHRHPIVAWSLRIAAVLCLCLGASYFAASAMFESKARKTIGVFIPEGQRMCMTLGDGTTVWLNSGTRLEYPVVFGSKERRVKVSGEALFDVKHDAAHPFIVETFACEVEVLGTKFNVKANEKTRDFATALLRGRLKVTNVRNPSERIMMHTDDMVCLKEGGLVLTKIDDPDDYLWVEGFINIRSSSFEELMKRLEKTYGTRIIIERKTCPHLEVIRGKIPISMGLDYVLRTLQKFTPFEYVRDNDANVIRIR